MKDKCSIQCSSHTFMIMQVIVDWQVLVAVVPAMYVTVPPCVIAIQIVIAMVIAAKVSRKPAHHKMKVMIAL